MDYLTKALLTASLLAAAWRAVGPVSTGRLDGDDQNQTGRWEPDLPETYLSEAQQIAERGPMPLYLADVHLHRARLAHAFPDLWPDGDPRTELNAARELIEKHNYGRRTEELADAETALNAR
ncbi:hypothetical protein GC176_26955 [bacterium]|nr:hypothetical protein [bacterium]